MTPELAFLTLWGLLAVYSVLMAIDLGAGAIYAWAYVRREQEILRLAEAYASPVWEAVNSLLILVLLAMEAFFPKAINTYATVLLVPLGLTFLLLSVRQVGFAMRHERPPVPVGLARWLNPLLFGVVGPLAPLPAMTFFTVLQGRGFSLVHGVPVYALPTLILSPLTLSFMALALVAELHLASSFLAWFAALAEEGAIARRCRLWARRSALWVAALALLALWVLAAEVPPAREALGRQAWLFLGALLALAAAQVAARRAGGEAMALAGSVLMFLGGYMALGAAQYPYLIRGQVTVRDAFTNPPMAQALGPVFLAGFLFVVLPSALLLTAYVVREARRRAQTLP